MRCSTSMQDYGRQKNDLLAFAERNGFETEERFIFGELVTGKDDKRKGDRQSIKMLLDSCGKGLVDVVLISEVSRLTRGFLYGVNFIDSFNRDYKIPIYFRDKKQWTIDIETGVINDRFEKDLRKYFEQSEAELETIRIRFASGRKDAAGMNQAIGSKAPFGYRRVDKKNVPDPETSGIVREAYAKYLEDGSTLKETAKYLAGKYPQYARKLRYCGTIRRILRNKGNTGTMTYSIFDEVDKETYQYDVEQPALIDGETYRRALGKLEKNRTLTRYDRKKHLLQKTMRCYDCGAFLTPASGGYYRCIARMGHLGDCRNSIALNEGTADKVIWGFIRKELFSAASLNEAQKEEAIASQMRLKTALAGDREAYENALSRGRRRLDRIQDLLIDNLITKGKYVQERDAIEAEMASNEAAIRETDAKMGMADLAIRRLSAKDFTDEYFAGLEKDISKGMAFVKEHVEAVYPMKAGKYILYKVLDRAGSAYYIFYEKVKPEAAWYVNFAQAVYQGGGERIAAYEAGEYFVLPNASSFIGGGELEAFAGFDEMKGHCEANGQVIGL